IDGAGNLIVGNGGDGVLLADEAFLNLVLGNIIGTDPAGTRGDLGNAGNGVTIQNSSGNTIGGAVGNLISGNGVAGVRLVGTGRQADPGQGRSAGNVVQANLIGTDIMGTLARGNVQGGIVLNGDVVGNTIGGLGGPLSPARNLISG